MKRKKHGKSILHKKDGTCYLCMKNGDYTQKRILHEHHIYGGPNRTISEEYGFKVYLCIDCHLTGPAAVHKNKDSMRTLQRDAQDMFERTHPREEFMGLIGRNYL